MNPKKEAILNRLVWLAIGRPLLAIPVLTLTLFSFHSVSDTSDARLFYFFIVLRGCLTLFYFIVFKGSKTLHGAFIALQLVLDLFLESVLIGVTGHVESPFSILYIGTIASSAYIFYEKGGILTATAALLLLGMTVFFKEIRSTSFDTPILFDTPYRLFLHALAFYSVGIVSGLFFSKIDEARTGLSKLKVLHEDIVKSIPSGVLTTDSAGKITSFNQAAFLITGISPVEAIDRIWWDLFSWAEIQNQYKILAESGISRRFEGEILKRGNTARPCFLGATISPLSNGEGETVGVIGIFQDLTQLKMMEEEIFQKRRLALMGEMAARMAHEIRNPLASLSGAIQLLQKEPSLLAENRRLMEIALGETDRLNAIITDFLLYARPNPLRKMWVSLNALLGESVEFIKKSESEATQVLLKMSDPLLEIFVDPDQIKQVFWNLAINAFSAMPQGGVLTLTTQNGKDKNGKEVMLFTFHDTGTGISKENLPKIFDPFFTTKSSGSGLGLSIVQRIIQQHDGTIEVASSSAGTTINIAIPTWKKS